MTEQYQVLARKWRPKTFAELKGQEHVTRALVNAITRGELHHAYLFTGTRGVGKTSVARILAKCFNCEQGVSATPCGLCSACTSIDAGRFVDLIEVDGASRTRVEDTRELLENVQYAPSVGRYKIYLIDEVHMLSTHSFNALLKTLEEPPPHVKFILATTDPERIPVTVLSRCLRFVLKALSDTEIAAQLAAILTAENISFEEQALQMVAKAGAGSMRDALSLLEQANAYSDGILKRDAVEEMLGLGYQRYLPDLMKAIAANDVKASLQFVEEMSLIGADFEQSMASLLQILHGLAIAQALNSDAVADFAALTPELLALKNTLTPEAVQLLYQICLMAQKDLPLAPTSRIGFEMGLLRMMLFRPKKVTAASSMTQAEKPVAPLTAPMPVQAKEVKPAAPAAPPQVAAAPMAAAPMAAAPVAVAPMAAAPTQVITTPKPVAPQHEDGALNWIELIPKLALTGVTLMVVKNCIISNWDGNHLVLILDVYQKTCLNPVRQTQIQEALSHYFGKPIKLTIQLGDVGTGSPIKVAEVQAQRKVEEAHSSIEQDKVVQNILSTFDATVEKISVKE